MLPRYIVKRQCASFVTVAYFKFVNADSAYNVSALFLCETSDIDMAIVSAA